MDISFYDFFKSRKAISFSYAYKFWVGEVYANSDSYLCHDVFWIEIMWSSHHILFFTVWLHAC